MKTLIAGQVPDLIKNFRDGGTSLQEQLFKASDEDRAATSEAGEGIWIPVDARKIAKEKISQYFSQTD
jgi:hypothetical protein